MTREAGLTEQPQILPGQVGEGFLRHAQNPSNLGVMARPSGRAMEVGQCGDSVEIFIQVDNDTISQIKVMPHGCLYTVVCASAVSELAQGLTLDGALQLEPEQLERELGGLPEDHQHCARLAINTLGEAINDYYQTRTSGAPAQAAAKE